MKRKRGMMSPEMARSIIDEVGKTKMVKLLLFHLMGEPTLHPSLVDIAEYAHHKKVDVCITTNGIHMKMDLLEKLIKADVRKIILSLQTPDDHTFSMRGAKGLSFEEYAEHVTSLARVFINETNHKTELIINFLSSPLRKLIFPIARELCIADTSIKLREYLKVWAERISKGTVLEDRLSEIQKQIKRARSFKENTITLNNRLSFHTRIVGDWATHFDKKIAKAHFGYCNGIQDNLGILWNGNYTFCCVDYDGRTSTHNYNDTSILDYLSKEEVQRVVKGFRKFRVLHPYCKQCLGDKKLLNSIIKQAGSIVYFKWIKKN